MPFWEMELYGIMYDNQYDLNMKDELQEKRETYLMAA